MRRRPVQRACAGKCVTRRGRASPRDDPGCAAPGLQLLCQGGLACAPYKPCTLEGWRAALIATRPRPAQVDCHKAHTSAATEALVLACVAAGRGARFASGRTAGQGGATEPRCACCPAGAALCRC